MVNKVGGSKPSKYQRIIIELLQARSRRFADLMVAIVPRPNRRTIRYNLVKMRRVGVLKKTFSGDMRSPLYQIAPNFQNATTEEIESHINTSIKSPHGQTDVSCTALW